MAADPLLSARLRPCVAVIPAYNEAPAITAVVTLALAQRLDGWPVFDQIIVVDNDSSDNTTERARAAGAHVVHQPERGYGAACLKGIEAAAAARCRVFIDGDASVDLSETARLPAPLVASAADLVIGARHNPLPGAVGLPQRFGNRLASALTRLLWRVSVADLGPFRAVRGEALAQLAMRDRRFGWTVEMQLRAIQTGLRPVEAPVQLLPRVGRSKISGTVRGVIGAARGIFGTIIALRWAEHQRARQYPTRSR